MTPAQFIWSVKHGLPSCEMMQIDIDCLYCRVRYGGQVFDISCGVLDGFPFYLVTTSEQWMNAATNAVLERLDSIADEAVQRPAPWADTSELMRRLRELIEEGGEDESA
jgi:hypothetical protein